MFRTIISSVVAFAATAIAAASTPDLNSTFERLKKENGVEATLTVVDEFTRMREPILSGMHSNILGYAVRMESGMCHIFIREDQADKWTASGLLEHEYAHCVAWHKHGDQIASHGSLYRETCRDIATQWLSCRAVQRN